MTQTAYTISADNQVAWIDSSGDRIPLSDKGFALQINSDVDGTIWAVTSDIGPNGNNIWYLKGFPENKSKWLPLDKSLGADQVVARTPGKCVFLAPDQSIHTADDAGNHEQIAPPGTAQQIATLNAYPIYIMSNEIEDGGAVIKQSGDEGKTWTVVNNGSAAKAQQILVQIYNYLVFLDEDGRPGFLDASSNNAIKYTGPRGLGLNLGLGGQNQWWVVSTDTDEKGGNLLKYWGGQSSEASDWFTTKNNFAGIAVAGN